MASAAAAFYAAPANGASGGGSRDPDGAALRSEAAKIRRWWSARRFAHTERPYTAESVAALRQSIPVTYPSAIMADKLFGSLRGKFSANDYTLTFGALDPVQVAQMAPHVDCVYVSGWQCAATASTTNEPGPDFADYPMNTVPNKVDQLFRSQLFHDRKQREERAKMTASARAAKPATDYLRPLIADADTGHGGLPAVMRLTKLMIEAGAAGIHLEDQKPGAKKCGHMGGKVLVATREHCDRLYAARLQADMCGAPLVIVARTDASSAQLIDSNIDPRDHPFIVGCTNPELPPLDEVLTKAKAAGASSEKLVAMETDWIKSAALCRFADHVESAIQASSMPDATRRACLAEWRAKAPTLSNPEARKLAAELGFADLHWDWDAPRSREGYYRIQGGTDFCVARARAFAPAADLIWMETSSPNLPEAREFATGVHATHPHQMLAYNLSPSFNWDAAGLTDDEIADFPRQLGKLGFVWQFITLAGFHSNALVVTRLARALAGPDSVLAYVRDIQRKEREENVSTLTHQRWAGAGLADRMVGLATGGAPSATASMGAGVTEAQFTQSKL